MVRSQKSHDRWHRSVLPGEKAEALLMERRTSPTVALLKYIVDLFIEMYLVDNKYAELAMNLKETRRIESVLQTRSQGFSNIFSIR